MSDPKARKTSSTLLEVEDEDARQLRIGAKFSRGPIITEF